MKDILTEIKTNLQGFNSRREAVNQISGLEIKNQNLNQHSKKKKELKRRKCKESLEQLQSYQHLNHGSARRRERERN